LVRRAVRDGQMTALDLAAAETASTQAHTALLDLQKQANQQRLELKRAIGLSADTPIRLHSAIELPARLDPPPASQLLQDLEQRRLDLVALHRGYESQEETVRAEILTQFPKLNIGVNRQSDASNVGTIGLGVSINLPLFDRNQGTISRESATRQKLFDEYVNRVFEARAEIARLLDNARALNEQLKNRAAARAGLELLVNTYRTAVGSGQADVLSYYTAWNNFTQNEIDLLSLKQELIQTSVALELASGLYRLDALSAPPAAGAAPIKER